MLFGFATSKVQSFDVFWQLQSGKYILDTQSFIYQNIFSLAADAPRHEHCWLHDIVYYLTYCLMGFEGLSLLKGLLVAGTGFFLVRVARLRDSSWSAILIVLFPVFLQAYWAWEDRPQLWSFFFFALFLWLLEWDRISRGRKIYLLGPLMIIWGNLHAGAILAFPLVVAYMVGRAGRSFLQKDFWPKDLKRLGWVLLMITVAACITPYGLMLLKTLAGSASLGGQSLFAENIDWRVTTFKEFPNYFYIMGGTALCLAIAWRRVTLTDALLLAGLAFMGTKLLRHTTFFMVAVTALVPVYIDGMTMPLVAKVTAGNRTVLKTLALFLAVIATFYFGHSLYKVKGAFNPGLLEWRYPDAAVDFILEQQLPANLFNSYVSGGYLMWKLYPDYRVFWDGRQGSEELNRAGNDITYARAGWQQLLDRYQVNTVVTEPLSFIDGVQYPMVQELRKSAFWALVFADQSSVVFVRKAAVEGRWLMEHQLPARRLDEAILAEAALLVERAPGPPKVHWEMARIHLARKEYRNAYGALEKYLSRIPPGQRNASAETYYRLLDSMFGRNSPPDDLPSGNRP